MKSNQSLGILFFIRKEKGSSLLKAPIYLRLTVNHQHVEIFLKRTVEISKWVPHAGRAKGNVAELRQLNEYLNVWENRVFAAQKELIEKKLPVTADTIKKLLVEQPKAEKTLFEVFEYHNVQFAENVRIDRSNATLTRYKTTLNLVKQFLKQCYLKDNIPLSHLNYKFATDFEHFLKTVRLCNQNTTSKYIKNLMKIVHMAILNKWLDQYPFAGFKTPVKPVDRGYLNEEELEILEKKAIGIPRIEAVRDIFVFCCYTGLAYTDVAHLSWEHIITGTEGGKWINIARQKTAIKSKVPILPKAYEVMLKFKYNPSNKNVGRIFPILTNQRMNSYLKEIADLCGITKNLTFHLARHTFATTITLANGVPIESVSSMLGHTNIKTTQLYAKVIEKKVSEDMFKLRDVLSSNRKRRKAEVSEKPER